MGIPPDHPSLITCERCEIVLHPGFNCTIRIENKFSNVTQNNVVYKSYYCLNQNLKYGTFKGHMKGICPPKEKSSSHESGKSEKGIMNIEEANETNVFASPLEGRKRKVYMLRSNKVTEPTSMSAKKATSTSSKRRRKSWTSLNEIAQSSGHNSRTAKLSIPFIFYMGKCSLYWKR